MLGGISIVGALIKVAVVFALLWVTLKLVARVHRNSGGTGITVRKPASAGGGRVTRPAHRLVEIMGRSQLGRNTSIVLVRVGDSCLALGVSEQQVNLLYEVDLDLDTPNDDDVVVLDTNTDDARVVAGPARTQAPASGPAWRNFVENLRERTVRR